MASLSVLFGLFQEALSERWCSLSSWGQSLEACMFWRAELVIVLMLLLKTHPCPHTGAIQACKVVFAPQPPHVYVYVIKCAHAHRYTYM